MTLNRRERRSQQGRLFCRGKGRIHPRAPPISDLQYGLASTLLLYIMIIYMDPSE